MRYNLHNPFFLLSLLVVFQISQASIFRVSKTPGPGEYSTIQAAVNKAGIGDTVQIAGTDTYEEQVTIENKSNLTICSENPKSKNKPTIKYQDKTNTKPTTWDEAQSDSTINFDKNGALRFLTSRRITIDGINIDGGGTFPFGAANIWGPASGTKYPLQHGNACVTLWFSGEITIRNSDLSNAYIGINVKDRNYGGVYANPNPADIDKYKIIPLSGFGKTGNHLIENNRIHNNSWGFYFESSWDLGSVIRYNLIYNNYHQTALLASTISKLTSEGGNLPGGAFYLKDNSISPLAIYNNTFWKNTALFITPYRPGAQHLVFNNIFGSPNGNSNYSSLESVVKYDNRMHHCVFACQEQKPQITSQKFTAQKTDPATNLNVTKDTTVSFYNYVAVKNDFSKPASVTLTIDVTLNLSSGPSVQSFTVANAILEGSLLSGEATKPFPATAEVRWIEDRFQSTDPDDPNFLEPDWDDPLVNKYILDNGWPEAGIKDADGSIADIGAIPYGGRLDNNVTIYPTTVVMLDQARTTATLSFDLRGDIVNPKIKYIRWIKNIPFDKDAWGVSKIIAIPTSDIIAVTASSPVKKGRNDIKVSIPAQTAEFGFFELIIEGEDKNGKAITSAAGFLPYRKLEYIFIVEVWDENSTRQIDTVHVGQPVQLKIKGCKAGTTTAINATFSPVDVTLLSANPLFNATGTPLVISSIVSQISVPVIFTKVPEEKERVQVSGVFANDSQAIRGDSRDLVILPGTPEKIKFIQPVSHSSALINPGELFTVQAQITDKYDNKVIAPTQATLISHESSIGRVTVPTVNSNASGIAEFSVEAIGGDLNDTIPLEAVLDINNANDSTSLVIGKSKDRLWIFYDDTNGYNRNAAISGCSGIRFPVTIRAQNDSVTIVTDRTTTFSIELTSGLAAYASESAADTARLMQYQLANGEARIWITSTTRAVSNGFITVQPDNDKSINGNSRENISFNFCVTGIERSAYFADNGNGQVDLLSIWYENAITPDEIPDSLVLYWPNKSDNNRRVVSKNNITINANDSHNIIARLPLPFDETITYSSIRQLGISCWKNPLTPDAQSVDAPFAIEDSVGPLLMSATLLERIIPTANDTMYVTLSESVSPSKLIGQTLSLQKSGTSVFNNITILNATPYNGDTIMLEIENSSDTPAEGDSLKINSSSSVADVNGNHAHPKNRPIKIKLRPIPATVAKAAYFDTDGNGVVERAVITFDKEIIIGNFSFVFTWDGNHSSTISGTKVQTGADPTIAVVDLNDAFSFNTQNRTSGQMMVSVSESSFPGEKQAMVDDSAAPVIVSAVYSPGSALPNETFAKDTLQTIFSEEIKIENTALPLRFMHDKDEYRIFLSDLQVLSKGGRFLVDSITGVEYPVNNDSVFIATQPDFTVQDLQGNFQKVEMNKKVQLTVKPQPYTIAVTVGPNPFKSIDQNVTFTIKPVAKMKETVSLKATMSIYDQMGKVIANFSGETAKGTSSLVWKWNGENLSGRKAGAGTYLAIVNATDTNPQNNAKPVSRKLFVGIKR